MSFEEGPKWTACTAAPSSASRVACKKFHKSTAHMYGQRVVSLSCVAVL